MILQIHVLKVTLNLPHKYKYKRYKLWYSFTVPTPKDFQSACVYPTELLQWRGRPCSVRQLRFLGNRSTDHGPILCKSSIFILFSFSLTWDSRGAFLKKKLLSCKVHPNLLPTFQSCLYHHILTKFPCRIFEIWQF